MKGFRERLLAIAEVEVRHILREPRTLIVVLLQPLILLVLYGYCISLDLRHTPIAVWDQDRTELSRQLVTHLAASGGGETFNLIGTVTDPRQIDRLLSFGGARAVLVIPQGYQQELSAHRPVSLQALIDGADPNAAGVVSGYLQSAINARSARLATGGIARGSGAPASLPEAGAGLGGETLPVEPIALRWRVFYNPDLSSKRFYIPGLIAVMLTSIAATITSTTIVRERELGPLEALLTAPIRPAELVLGKMLPYVGVATVTVGLVLLASGLIFGVWPRGSLLDLATFSLLFLLGMLALGMLISSRARTQQLALVAATFSTMLPNMFLTGFAFPRSNMPAFLQAISTVLPATHYIVALRSIFLKGMGWEVLWPQGLWMAFTAAALMALAIRGVGRAMERGLE